MSLLLTDMKMAGYYGLMLLNLHFNGSGSHKRHRCRSYNRYGRVYALGQGGRMAAYELLTGQRIWELSLAGISTPAIAGEWIFTLTDDARILAIARSMGGFDG